MAIVFGALWMSRNDDGKKRAVPIIVSEHEKPVSGHLRAPGSNDLESAMKRPRSPFEKSGGLSTSGPGTPATFRSRSRQNSRERRDD